MVVVVVKRAPIPTLWLHVPTLASGFDSTNYTYVGINTTNCFGGIAISMMVPTSPQHRSLLASMLRALLPSSSSAPNDRSRRLHHRHSSSFKSTNPSLNSLNSYISNVAKKLAKIILHSSIFTATVLMLQLLYVIYRTPRLPPPPLSGVDFPREGRRMVAAATPLDQIADDDLIKSETSSSTTTITKQKEFRLVLIGDSPVEGVGNATHNVALSGQTAKAFAQKVVVAGGGGGMQQRKKQASSDHYNYDCVRYWSYGKSGLTARGIEEEMIPYLHRVVADTISTSSEEVHQNSSTIHAIVLLCGVNNVLDVNSTASSFYLDVHRLIRSIRNNPRLMNTPLIVLGLPDFSLLPFLPWPLAFALGWRGRMMQRMLEKAIREIQLNEQERNNTMKENKGKCTRTILKVIPNVQTVLGSIGYHCYRSSEESDKPATIQMRFCHPLLKYLGGIPLTQDRIASLGMTDFLCDDGFHPGKLGTVYVGNLIREAYEEIMKQSK